MTHRDLSANQIEASLRRASPPVIARIVDDRVLLDLRTVGENEESALERAILSLPS
jgi:seryl-tRNA(Sec) selenium transferase